MINIIALLLFIVAFFLCTRLFLLVKSIKNTKQQLSEINKNIEENRIVTLSSPDKLFEELLEEINNSLKCIRDEKLFYEKREKQFKQQIENISHDLRTPLTSMLGYLKIMDVSNLNKEEQEDIQIVIRKAENLQDLITQFYDYSRLIASDYPLELECVDVINILKESLVESYNELTKYDLEVITDILDEAVFSISNKKDLQRVFQNLLQNAGRYAKSFLKISTQVIGEKVCISFSNDVDNMNERDVERIFERFYTMDQSRNSNATGLGLTIVKELIEKMNGQITAKLEGQELTMEVSLKIHKSA